MKHVKDIQLQFLFFGKYQNQKICGENLFSKMTFSEVFKIFEILNKSCRLICLHKVSYMDSGRGFKPSKVILRKKAGMNLGVKTFSK